MSSSAKDLQDVSDSIRHLIHDMRFRSGMASSIRIEHVNTWLRNLMTIDAKLDQILIDDQQVQPSTETE